MAVNTAPIYSRRGQVSRDAAGAMNQPITAGSNTYDGTNANASLVFTADATEGSFVQRIRFKAAGSNIQTVARIFINNGSTPGTAANNVFYGEQTLPLITASAVAATNEIDYPLGFALPPGYRIYVLLATAVASGWVATVIGGDY